MTADKRFPFDDPVFVLGPGRNNSLGVVRCFGRRGIPVFLIASSRLRLHRFCRYGKVLRSPTLELGEDRYAEFLLEEARRQPKPPVLIATNDQVALYTLTYRDSLEPHVRFTSSPLDVSKRIIDKAEFYSVASEAGVDHPQTLTPSTLEDARIAANEIGYPCLLKPANSCLFASIFHLKCFLVGNRDELAACWREVEPTGLRMLVQEIIPGRRIYMWYGYYDRESRLVACFGYHKTRQNPPDFGCGSLVTAANEQDKIEMADTILRHVGYHGIVEPEFKYDPRDGRWKILEINARTSTQNRLSASAGLDMEYMAYLEAIGQPLSVPSVDRTGLLWTDTLGDFSSAFSDPEMTVTKWLSSRRGPKVHAFFAWDDPLPVASSLSEITRSFGATLCKRWYPGLYQWLRKRRIRDTTLAGIEKTG